MRYISVITTILAILSAPVSVPVAFAGNLVVNGGFENGLAGWEGGVIDNNLQHSGAACLRVVDDDPNGDIAAFHLDIIPIDQAKTYLFQVWVRCKNEGQ